MTAEQTPPSTDAEPDWCELLHASPGPLWQIPHSVVTFQLIDGDHWRRLIELADSARADLAIRYGCSLIGGVIGVDPNFGYDFDLAFGHAAMLAHVVHPYTIAADTGHPTELDYYHGGIA